MSITVGRKNPQILGGIDSINKPQGEVVVDDLQQSEELKSIDEVKVQGAVESAAVAESEAPEAEVKKPRRGRKSKKSCES